eukprot:UN24953
MSSILVEHNANKGIYRLYVKGAVERIVNGCTDVAFSSGVGSEKNLESVIVKKMTDEESSTIMKTMELYAGNGLRTLGFAYKELQKDDIKWEIDPETNKEEPVGIKMNEDLTFCRLSELKILSEKMFLMQS